MRRCLAKDPDDRWQSAIDLASELKWIAQGSAATFVGTPAVSGVAAPSPASGAESRTETGSRPRRVEPLAWLVVSLALLAVIAALSARSFFNKAEPPRRLFQSQPEEWI